MSTHFQKLLKEKADSPLFSGKGDEAHDGEYYLVAGFDIFLSLAGKALVADGIDPQLLMKMLISHALEVLERTHGYKGSAAATKDHHEMVLQEVLRIRRQWDDDQKAMYS